MQCIITDLIINCEINYSQSCEIHNKSCEIAHKHKHICFDEKKKIISVTTLFFVISEICLE